jgi:tetratricopeptide (TPR) repeat protein
MILSSTRGPAYALWVFLAIVAAVPPLSAQKASPDLNEARSAMAAGIAAANSGNLDQARIAFERAVKLAPNVSATHAALGSVLLSQKEMTAALQELTRAHGLDPGDVSIDLNLARAEAESGGFDGAVPLFRAALASSPPAVLSEDESLAYAKALAGTGDFTSAETALRNALVTAPDSARLNDALGTLLAQGGQLDQALPFFRHAIADDPTFARAQYHLGAALVASDQPQEALAPLEAAATATPNSFDVELQLGLALSALNKDIEALSHLRRAAELRASTTPPAPTYSLAMALQASGDPKSALPLFELALSDGSFASSSALINDALAHVQTGDATGALPLYNRALKAGPDSAILREDFGVAYLQQADLGHAIEQFKMGLALEPENSHLHYDLGLALKLKDDLPAAIPEFERSAQLDPTLPDPAYTLGVIYMQQGKFPEAAAQLQRATTLQPGNGDAWALLGSVLKDSGDPKGATEALQRAIALEPNQPSLHVQLATLESQAGDKEAAAAERKIAAELSREANSRQRAGFALNSGRVLLQQNKLDDAILQLNTAAQADPTLVEPHRLLAEAYGRQGKSADAALERQRAAAIERKGATGDSHP